MASQLIPPTPLLYLHAISPHFKFSRVPSWSNETFISSYLNISLFFLFYFSYKFVTKSKIVSLQDMDIRRFIDIANENPEPLLKRPTGWRRFNILWS